VINTVTNIVSMLMVFVIQNTQNRESCALQLKVDELLRAVRGAQNTFINLEELSEEDLNELKDKSAARAESARQKAGQAGAPVKAASRTRKLVAGSHPDPEGASRLVTQAKSG
jgi:low affinity Fe/Cu permease